MTGWLTTSGLSFLLQTNIIDGVKTASVMCLQKRRSMTKIVFVAARGWPMSNTIWRKILQPRLLLLQINHWAKYLAVCQHGNQEHFRSPEKSLYVIQAPEKCRVYTHHAVFLFSMMQLTLLFHHQYHYSIQCRAIGPHPSFRATLSI